MKKFISCLWVFLLIIGMSGIGFAQENGDEELDAREGAPYPSLREQYLREKPGERIDITETDLVGPGDVGIMTTGDIRMSFGARARVIPVSETDWDFGLADSAPAFGFLNETFLSADLDGDGELGGPLLSNDFFKIHPNETGSVGKNYIRTEIQLYFNALPEDRNWSFHAALEYDRPLDVQSVDERGGRNFSTSNSGFERLQGTLRLPFNTRLHAGFDIWEIDGLKGAGLVYGDDAPGIWLTGNYDLFDFNVGYFKLHEDNFQVGTTLDDFGGKNDDRDLYAGYLNFELDGGHEIRPFYAFDRMRNAPVAIFPTGTLAGTNEPDTDSHYLGAYYLGNLGPLNLFFEGAYMFGQADDTGLANFNPALADDYDISAYALSGDAALELSDLLEVHLGGIYTSGDDDPTDDELNGFVGVVNAQRFSPYFGGEHTIIGDTNFLLGSVLYGYIPELYGNGTPVAIGGLENFIGTGNGRGDNPGMTMASGGITLTPTRFLIFRSNVNAFWWNEDISVGSLAVPVDPATGIPFTTTVDSGYAGTEWDNELTLATSQHSIIKGHFSFFFPGEVIEDITSARTSIPVAAGGGGPGSGPSSDDTAIRLGLEFIWLF